MDTLSTLRGYETLERNNYEAVMNHIANVGPLSVAVDASGWSFYSGGVFDGCKYDRNIEINHGMSFLFAVYSNQFKVIETNKKESKPTKIIDNFL